MRLVVSHQIFMILTLASVASSALRNRILNENDYGNSAIEGESAFGKNTKLKFKFPANSSFENGKIWAVLVAGSSGYDNYRHQADICHAYHVLRRHGIPAENIITMMYDDIAYSEENPTPGIIVNDPSKTAENVYKGVKIDYRRDDVTPKNFLNVLLGHKHLLNGIGSGRVLESNQMDRIFINFADHGGTGLVAFPKGELHAIDLVNTFKRMHSKKMFKEMVVYIEACESGSMFKGLLPKNINIYATTASNAEESSYACYYDNLRQTYLGDVYSVNWMHDSDIENLKLETIEAQFQLVQNETNTSHVQQFGSMDISTEPVSDFQGNGISTVARPTKTPITDAVSSRDVPLKIMQFKVEALEHSLFYGDNFGVDALNKLRQHWLQLETMLKSREDAYSKVKEIVRKIALTTKQVHYVLKGRMHLTDHSCLKTVARAFSEQCFSFAKNSYLLQYVKVLVNLCELGFEPSLITSTINEVCGDSVSNITGII